MVLGPAGAGLVTGAPKVVAPGGGGLTSAEGGGVE